MNDWVSILMATVVAPALSGLFAYLVTRRRDKADSRKSDEEANNSQADTAVKYRGMLNSEIEERRKAQERCDELDDAFRQCVDENDQLRAENRILRDQIVAAGIRPLTVKPDTRPRRGTNNDGAIGGGG